MTMRDKFIRVVMSNMWDLGRDIRSMIESSTDLELGLYSPGTGPGPHPIVIEEGQDRSVRIKVTPLAYMTGNRDVRLDLRINTDSQRKRGEALHVLYPASGSYGGWSGVKKNRLRLFLESADVQTVIKQFYML